MAAVAQTPPANHRPLVGVAFGGGSARGFAHVGVIRWFEEHHVPIDFVAGTSMGGLVGGAFASGMSSEELGELLRTTNWDEMFGDSPFRYKNLRRKEDARDYPSRLEFGFRRGIVPPPSINNGQQVDLLLASIAAPYLPLRSFDELPTPFRCVAVDLVTAQAIVLDHGSLADAMRATMSLPGVFPPVDLDGHVLVDGGALNNVPADVVRAMGADVVIAVPVGDASDTRQVNYSLYALADQTVDATMRATTRVAMGGADIVINPARGFGSLDWRRSDSLAADGYRAAESMKAKLLPLALDDSAWATYQRNRADRRQRLAAMPTFIEIIGANDADRTRMQHALSRYIGRPLSISALGATLDAFAGLDRYETVTWRLAERNGAYGLEIIARPKRYAPPFFMFGTTLANTAADLFAFQIAARYLAFDVAGPGSELRLDVAIGARPDIAAALYRPIGQTRYFVAASASATRRNESFVHDDAIIAEYAEWRAGVGADAGVNIGRDDELRIGITADRLHTYLLAGNPLLPDLRGFETQARVRWTHDGQDSPVVPSGGTRATGTIGHLLASPDASTVVPISRSNDGLTNAELTSSTFWTVHERDRVFVVAGAGTSFDGRPLPTEQFELGGPLHLSAYDPGELRGDHYGLVTLGYLRRVGRLPDFVGGPAFAGAWIENGSAFDDLSDATVHTNVSVGAIVSTLAGPAVIGASVGLDGHWRYYLGIGRLF